MQLHPLRRVCAVLFLLTFSLGMVHAGVKDKTLGPDKRLEAYAAHQAMVDQSLFKNVNWQFLGPTNISGRMTDVAVVSPKGEHYTIYVAGASGGVWKTVNEGVSWEPVFEHEATASIGDIALDPQNQETIWVGTGEANIFRSSQSGAGIYVSKDGGTTWAHKGLEKTLTIARILVHPENSDVIYVAASGHEWTDNEERGVYKTTDGGETWTKIHYINERTGAYDLVMDPRNPDVIYAAMWQRIRKKWNDPRIDPGYAHSGIWKTTDGGATWTAINEGLPQPIHRGRIGIDLCAAQPDVVYAFVDNYEIAREYEGEATDAYGRPKGGIIKGATVYKSTNGGSHWTRTSEENEYMEGLGGTYGWVFGQMRCDPVNPDKIYVMGLALNVSEDSGKTLSLIHI
jgi:photosystem II stability/assembly factor-like uncharacterized protein